ncbi:MAG TPA: DinB family protein [Bryobacteraceae bacterium]|nr:DinB family protein [Bryobacteraceae bacterium]
MSPAEAKSIGNMLIEGIEREYETTKKVIAAIPQNQLDFKLGEKGRTMRELAWHLAASEAWFGEGIANRDFSGSEAEMPAKATVTDLTNFYTKEVPAKIAKVKKLTGEQLMEIINFFGVMQVPNFTLIGFWNNHSIHHRGQLAAYLRAVNAHVPSIYGGSADEPFQQPASA